MAKKVKNDKKAYQAHADKQNQTHKRRSLVGRDIYEGWHDLAPTDDELSLRDQCKSDLLLFLQSYFPATFFRPFNQDQKDYIKLAQEVILNGDCHAIALPRGGGKSQILYRAVLWALLYGHRNYPIILAAKADFATDILKVIKQELSTNIALLKPFRAICYPLACLQGNGRKAGGQLFKGQNTNIQWEADRLVLATMPADAWDKGPNLSGSVVEASGITAALRGKSHLLPNGKTIRPDFVALDDPQDREAAQSPTQVANLLKIIRGDVLALAGQGQPIAAIAAVTVIAENDVADTLTNREVSPEWQGIRRAFIKSFPERMDLWDTYISERRELQRQQKDLSLATQFYIDNRTEMDRGAVVADENAKEDRDISALQWAMNKRALIGEQEFASEFQNQPLKPDADGLILMTAAEIAAKTNDLERGELPTDAQYITAFIDCGDKVLHWVVVGWSQDFNGWVCDYGLWPDQNVVFSKRVTKPLPLNGGKESTLRAGVEACVAFLKGKTYRKETGEELPIERILIDSGYLPDTIHDYCRGKAPTVIPSRGRFFGAKNKPIEEFAKKPGERYGHRWIMPAPPAGRSQRVIAFDANYYKSFLHARLSTPLLDDGSLSFWGNDKNSHSVIAQHCLGEFPTRVSAEGRVVDEWQEYPDHRDNHFLDCLVGCCVAASQLGAKLKSNDTNVPKVVKTYKFSQVLAKKQKPVSRSIY